PNQREPEDSRLLEGVVTAGGAALLVEPDISTFLIDLGFVPALPDCTASVSVSRAAFASDVRNREPVRPASTYADTGQSQHFFTEVVGAESPTTVVHYWFADGKPAALEVLDVQPSARWRTWSDRPTEPTGIARWQVLVVERPSGCILAQRSMVVEPGEAPIGRPAASLNALQELRNDFDRRSEGFPITEPTSTIAEVTLTQSYFVEALSAAMFDLHLVSRPTIEAITPLAINTLVDPIPGTALSCEARDCTTARACTVDFGDCPIRRDTRSCGSCLIRNPLNNRCVREAEDPICVAARDAENERLEDRRQACLTQKTEARDRCLLLRERELVNCRARASAEESACTQEAEAMALRVTSNQAIGQLRGQASMMGAIEFDFSEFRVDPDLARLRMRMTVTAKLDVEGNLAFVPNSDLNILSDCLRATEGRFDTPLALPLWQGGLATPLQIDGTALQANWSGLVQELSADPPLINQFVDNQPDWLADCALEVDSRRVGELLSGPGAELLRGALALDMQPEPTRISLLPAYLSNGKRTWTGAPQFRNGFIHYRLTEQD
ncbi:MAG: DUF2914 domain-containing protein, partial [Pseudomonadota bacterium]